MHPAQPPRIELAKSPNYREDYANSVQVRTNLWDVFLVFGRMEQKSPDTVVIDHFQGIYLSPQQAKAFLNVLQQNIAQYEGAFGEIRLEPSTPGSPIQ